MVYSITYRRPAHVNSSNSSVYSEKAAKYDSASTESSGRYGIPDALSFDNIINDGTCPPCSKRDFLNFLRYIEISPENLYFFLWFRDYEQRFNQLPESDKKLSPKWVDGRSIPKVTQTEPIADLEMTLSDNGGAQQAVSDAIKGTLFDPKAKEPASKVSCDSPSPSSSSSFITLRTTGDNHTERTLKAFESAKTFQPFTIQPFREELDRIIAAYISPDGSRRLNLSERESTQLLHALSITTHPSAFRHVVRTVEHSLRHQGHPNFIRWAIYNGNPPRVVLARGLGTAGVIGGLLCAVLLTLSSAERGWRVISAAGFFIGVATLIAAWKGMCVVLHGLHHRHLRPWELFPNGEDVDQESRKHSLESLQAHNSHESEPWVAQYDRRNLIRKIFDREVWIQEPALRQIQDTIFLQAVLGAFIVTALAMAIVIPLPKGSFF